MVECGLGIVVGGLYSFGVLVGGLNFEYVLVRLEIFVKVVVIKKIVDCYDVSMKFVGL